MKTFRNWWKSALVYLAGAGVGVREAAGVGTRESAGGGAGDGEPLPLADGDL